MNRIYLQLYSFGHESTLSLKEKLRVTADIGFTGVEFAGGYDNISAEELKQWLDEYNLEAISAHVPMNAISTSLPYMATLGAKMLIVPSHPFASKSEAIEVAELLNQHAKEGESYGIRVGYHNHTSEFYLDEGKPLLDYVIENTDPNLVSFELDCGWASAAGVNPVEYIRKHSGRFIAVHVKENSKVLGPDKPRSLHEEEATRPKFERDENGNLIIPEEIRRKFEEHMKVDVATGTGMVDWKAVKEVADAQGCIAYIIEREWSYNEPPDRIQCLREDFTFVKTNL